MNRESELRLIFSDIVKGYSKCAKNNTFIYFKHLSSISLSEVEHFYFSSYENAVREGIPTEKEKLAFLEEQGLWTKKDEEKIKNTLFYLDGLQKGKSKQVLKSQRDMIQKEINAQNEKLDLLKREKNELIGVTAEVIADKKKSYQIILSSTFTSEDLSKKYFSQEDEDYDEELEEVVNLFHSCTQKFNEKNLKSLSISSDFSLYFFLSKDSASDFYGKPVAYLSFYQAQLFHYAKYFSEILKECKDSIPFDIKNDPDKIIEWAEVRENVDKMLKDNEKQGKNTSVGIVGATKEDLKVAGLENQSINFAAEAAKKGGTLTIDDFIALQGD